MCIGVCHQWLIFVDTQYAFSIFGFAHFYFRRVFLNYIAVVFSLFSSLGTSIIHMFHLWLSSILSLLVPFYHFIFKSFLFFFLILFKAFYFMVIYFCVPSCFVFFSEMNFQNSFWFRRIKFFLNSVTSFLSFSNSHFLILFFHVLCNFLNFLNTCWNKLQFLFFKN